MPASVKRIKKPKKRKKPTALPGLIWASLPTPLLAVVAMGLCPIAEDPCWPDPPPPGSDLAREEGECRGSGRRRSVAVEKVAGSVVREGFRRCVVAVERTRATVPATAPPWRNEAAHQAATPHSRPARPSPLAPGGREAEPPPSRRTRSGSAAGVMGGCKCAVMVGLGSEERRAGVVDGKGRRGWRWLSGAEWERGGGHGRRVVES